MISGSMRNMKHETEKGTHMKIIRKIVLGSFVLATMTASAIHIDGNEIYLDEYLQVTTKKKLASYYCTLEESSSEGHHFKAYFLSGELKMDGWYADEEMTVEQGLFTYFYQSGQIESVGEYREGMKVGVWKRFDLYGKEKPERVYQSMEIMKAIEEAQKSKKE